MPILAKIYEWMDQTFLSISLLEWAVAGAVAVSALVVLSLQNGLPFSDCGD